MRILQINVVSGIRSTGRICTDLADMLISQGHECMIAYGREEVPERYRALSVRVGSNFDVFSHGAQSRILDDTGFGSKRKTEQFIEWVKAYNPDVFHLHNLHGYYINIEVLFRYLANANKPVVWTLHDCWPFTGHCTYFDYVSCEKWKTRCYECPNKKEYPKSILCDRSSRNYDEKKQLFCSVKNLTLVTPSRWLANLVKESFLCEHQVHVIHNGINLDVFKPTPSDFRKHHQLEEKFVILAVSNGWSRRKGFDDLMALAKLLDNNQCLVIVGISEKQKAMLPGNVIGILKTNNTRELAEIYTAADVVVNPTYEDNFPTVNIEALACGTPVITYPTGGSVEAIDERCGLVTEGKSPESLAASVDKACRVRFDSGACIKRAQAFGQATQYGQYIHLFEQQSQTRNEDFL